MVGIKFLTMTFSYSILLVSNLTLYTLNVFQQLLNFFTYLHTFLLNFTYLLTYLFQQAHNITAPWDGETEIGVEGVVGMSQNIFTNTLDYKRTDDHAF